MDLQLKGKVAWVVGGSAGIGFACARSLLGEGANVAISGRHGERLQRAVEKLGQKPGDSLLSIQADITDHNKTKDTLRAILETFGRLDILIYSAGISRHGTLMQVKPEHWRENWELNVVSFFHTVQLVVPEMIKVGGGNIVVLGAASGKQPTANQLISNTTKGSLAPMVKTLAEELAPHNILINNVCPGRFLTERRWELAKLAQEERGISADEYLREVADTVPLKRLGRPEEAADFITFLVSPKGSYITGQSITIDGGLVRSII